MKKKETAIFIDWAHQNDCQNLSFVKAVNVVVKKMARNGRLYNGQLLALSVSFPITLYVINKKTKLKNLAGATLISAKTQKFNCYINDLFHFSLLKTGRAKSPQW